MLVMQQQPGQDSKVIQYTYMFYMLQYMCYTAVSTKTLNSNAGS